MKSPPRRFVRTMLAITSVMVGGPALLNYAVDPYDRFGNNRMGVYISAEREAKATEVGRYPHNALFVGNSRMAMIPAGELKGFRFFNGAFAGANAEEVWWFVHHFAHKQELVVLGIDLGMKDPAPLKGDIFQQRGWGSAVENLVSLQTLEYSFTTILSHWSGKPSNLRPDGTFEIQAWVKRADREDTAFVRAQLEGMKRQWGAFVPPRPEEMTCYRKISATLRERGIPCVVVVPPMHEEVIRHIEAMGLQDEYQAWLDEVRALFPHVVDVSAGSYGSVANFYKADPMHFKPQTGVRFMNEEVLPVAMKASRDRAR